MHNCKEIKERITDLLLDGADPRLSLATELRDCAECREEFRALKETLQLTTRLIDNATPPDSFWPGYHARLTERLLTAQHPLVEPGQYRADRRPSRFSRFFGASIRVPVPVALAAAALVLATTLAFAFSKPGPGAPVVVKVPVPVEVPVIQEKTVERVVYREIRSRRSKPARVVAGNDEALASLDGFKPAEEVKLTVIKGGAANEK